MTRSVSVAIKSMRRSPYQSTVAILMMTVSFFVASCFAFLLLIANRALSHIETRPQVIGYFVLKASDQQIETVQQSMRGKDYVSSVKLVTKEEALAIFQEENKKDPLLAELVSADILPASIEVSAKSAGFLEKISADLRGMEGIEDVVYQKDIIDNLVRWSMILRQAGIVISGILFAITLLLIVVILSLRVATKRKEIGIMNLLGASRWYIRGPFIIEGSMYGIVGALMGWLCSFTILLYLTPQILGFFGEIVVLPIDPTILATMLASELLVGLFLGLFSSYLAVARFIKQ